MSDNVYAFNRTESEEERLQSLVDSAHDSIKHNDIGMQGIGTWMLELLKARVWEKRRAIGNGSFAEPTTFDAFVKAEYPVGLGSDHKTLRRLIDVSTFEPHRIAALELWDKVTARPAGGANNPQGLGGKSGKVADDDIVNVDSIHIDKTEDARADAAPRPSGTSVGAGLRRLTKAAEEGDSRAQMYLDDVRAGKITVNRACIEMGWRKPTITVRDDPDSLTSAAIKKAGPIETAMRAWRKMSMEDQEQFLEWASRNMATVADNGRSTR